MRLSRNGASTDVGTSATSVGDFTALLLDINPTYTTTGYPTQWKKYTVTISGGPAISSGRFAFRYFVVNGGPDGVNSSGIGIDAVDYKPYGCGIPTNFRGSEFGGTLSQISTFRPSTRDWWIDYGINTAIPVQFGLPTDQRVPGDYDGDGRTEFAVFRPSDGTWYNYDFLSGTGSSNRFGTLGDIAVPADYDYDGRTDLAIFRPSDGSWWIRLSKSGSVRVQQFGASGDIPLTGDYDGDSLPDLVVYRPSNSTLYFRLSVNSSDQALNLPPSAFYLKAADFDGDQMVDFGFYVPGDGTWVINNSGSPQTVIQWGLPTDMPVPADYDGDGRTDIAVYRPATSVWYIIGSQAGYMTNQFGVPGDIPLQSMVLLQGSISPSPTP